MLTIGPHKFDLSRPILMGILNITPDSFSDGGAFLNPRDAVGHAAQMASDGADIIDVGGESSRPGADTVSKEEELKRIVPIIQGIRRQSNTAISIDTTKAIVAKRAIEAGANMINDISAGRFDPEMFYVAAQTGVPICLMHMKGQPKSMQIDPHYDDVLTEIRQFLANAITRAEDCGIDRSKIIVDPGIGFGKTAEDNVKIIANLNFLSELNAPILIGTSRKSFIGKLLGLEVNKRLEATLATLAPAIEGGASILRVHDVAPVRRFLDAYMLCRADS